MGTKDLATLLITLIEWLAFSSVVMAATVATPTIKPSGGMYSSSVTVSLATMTGGARIYYTVDGSMPTEQSARYGGPFQLAHSTTVKARAFRRNWTPSGVAIALFSIAQMRQVIITWQDNSDAEDGFFIERNDSQMGWNLIGSVTENMKTFLDVVLTGGSYCWRLQAFNVETESEYSNESCLDL